MSPRNRWGWRYRLRNKARYWTSRWPIAGLLNRSPRTCWSDLVDWAMHDAKNHKECCVLGDDTECYHRLRNSLSGGPRCQAESAMHRDRMCYCAKFVNGCHGKARDAEFARMLADDERAHEQAGTS